MRYVSRMGVPAHVPCRSGRARPGVRQNCRNYVFAIGSILLQCTAVSAQPPRETATLIQRVGIDQRIGEQVPLDLTFRDETGQPVELRRYFQGNKPVILSLVYFQCPMLCNVSMDGLLKSLRTLELVPGDDFAALTVSFDPREGPKLARAARQAALDRYGHAGAEHGWHFLTGDDAEIRALTNAVGFRYTFDEKTRQYAHAAGLMVLTPDGHVSRYFFGVEYPPRDLRFALIDASSGNIGTPTDRLLMLCYQYDPTTGKYGFAIITLLRIGGVGTLLVLFGGIVWMLHRERVLGIAGRQGALPGNGGNESRNEGPAGARVPPPGTL